MAVVPGRFAGKVALCIGCTKGIGFSVAQRLAREGARVVISSRKQENVDACVDLIRAEGHEVRGVPCHATNVEQQKNLINRTLEEFGGIDLFYHNAGLNITGDVLTVPEEVYDKLFDVNVKSVYQLTSLVVPYMKQRGGGSIVYMGSVSAFLSPLLHGLYGPAKAALVSLTKVFGQALEKDNIRVNIVCPGIVDTKFGEVAMNIPGAKEFFHPMMVMKRRGKPEEVSGVVSFLLSDDASYVTCESIVIAGGAHVR